MPGTVGKVRNPWGVIGLSIITLGIYALYWYYSTYEEMKEYSGEGLGGVVGLIFAIVPILNLVNIFVLPDEVGKLYGREGQAKPVEAITGIWILLPIIGGIVWLIKVQGALNNFWTAHATGSGGPPMGQGQATYS
jgi:Domain of unknown function (DUF4234)